jgi:hypothetical protein
MSYWYSGARNVFSPPLLAHAGTRRSNPHYPGHERRNTNMLHMRDAVLEGANPIEIETLARLCRDPSYQPSNDIARRLQAKGWLDLAGGAHLVTLAGRTLVKH